MLQILFIFAFAYLQRFDTKMHQKLDSEKMFVHAKQMKDNYEDSSPNIFDFGSCILKRIKYILEIEKLLMH